MNNIFIVLADVNKVNFNFTAYIIFAVLLIIGTFFLVRYMIRKGYICNYCGDTDLKVWDRVPEENKELILSYFRNYEKREPDTSAIYVCQECKTVFDDFEGQRGKGNYHHLFTAYTGSYSEAFVSRRGFCKVCNNMMVSPDQDNDDIRCKKCNSLHTWKLHEPSGYWLFMPPEDVEILKECDHLARPV